MVATSGHCCLAAALFLLSGCSLACAYRVATSADNVPKPMLADTKFPDLTREIASTRLFAPSLHQYVNDPKTTCTIIAPTNQAINFTMEALGQYVGLFLQNKTMQEQLLNYHVIPAQKLKANQLGTTVRTINTRANETLLFVQHKGRPYVSFGRKYVVPLQVVDISAGGCIIHIINTTVLAPPSIIPAVEGWLKQAGNETALQSPEDLWLPATGPIPGPTSGQPGPPGSAVVATEGAGNNATAAPTSTSEAAECGGRLTMVHMSLLALGAAAVML